MERERAGSDVDVMVIGDAAFADVVLALASAGEALRREVSPNVYPPEEFAAKLAAGEPFLVIAEWENEDAYQGWLDNPVRVELSAALDPLLADHVAHGGFYGEVHRG